MRPNIANSLGICSKCGYDMSGLPTTAPCPECGLSEDRRFAPPTWSVRRCRCARAGALLLLVMGCLGAPVVVILLLALGAVGSSWLPFWLWFATQGLITIGVILSGLAVFGSDERPFRSTLWPALVTMLHLVSIGAILMRDEVWFGTATVLWVAMAMLYVHHMLMRFGDLAGQGLIYDRARLSLIVQLISVPMFVVVVYLAFGLIGIAVLLIALAGLIWSFIWLIRALADFFGTVPELRA